MVRKPLSEGIFSSQLVFNLFKKNQCTKKIVQKLTTRDYIRNIQSHRLLHKLSLESEQFVLSKHNAVKSRKHYLVYKRLHQTLETIAVQESVCVIHEAFVQTIQHVVQQEASFMHVSVWRLVRENFLF